MNRNASSHFDSFDPEVIEAARDVASRAGVPLEAWIASVVPQHVSPSVSTSQRETQHETDPAPELLATAEGVTALINRLDGLDRSMEVERQAAAAAEKRRLEDIELRIDRALHTAPTQQVTERLGDIERRVAELGDQVAGHKPPGKRGRASAAEMREAVQSIRQRQRDLTEQAPASGAVATMHRDLERRLVGDGQVDESPAERGASSLPGYVLDQLQREAARLQDVISPLARVEDVTALEVALDSVAGNIARVRSGAEMPTLGLPLAVIRTRLDELDLTAAGAVQTKLAADIKRFASRLEMAKAFEDAEADLSHLRALDAALKDIREAASALAEPERLGAVGARLQDLDAQIARLSAEQEAKAKADQDALAAKAALAVDSPDRPVELADEIHALAERVDSLQAKADRDVAPKRKDTAAASGEMASIQAMLTSLAEKVDRVGERNGPDSLDALEKQVLTLVDKIAAPLALDPALTSLERTMNDLMKQVEALRETSPNDAVIERAARTAVAETLKSATASGNQSEFGLLRASLADMQARQLASDERLSATLEGVQSALDRLVTRLGAADAVTLPKASSLEDRLLATTSVDATRAARRPATIDPVEPMVAAAMTETLLEPNTVRPSSTPPLIAEKREPALNTTSSAKAPDSDIKASFIAAARRAAQAAQAELAAELPQERSPLRPRAAASVSAPTTGPLSRFRSGVDQHRKPLLLGLAAVVLTLGAIQAITSRSGSETAPAQLTPTTDKAVEAPKVAETPKAPAASNPAAPGEAAKQDPTTTQTVAAPRPAESVVVPTKPTVPAVPNMAGLANDLANIPPAFQKVKQAALNGDGAAVWELATRTADGRGMPRDLATAAKLFEKLANVGYAPAQYKLGAHYEKGSGLTRDLAQAKLWYGRAAEQGHARAMHNLGVIYAENPAAGGKPDFASAASWFRQGAEHGIRDSQYNIAVLYARGLGLTQDLVQSYAWFAAAAGQGDDDAGKKRDDVGTKLTPSDLARAKNLASSFKPRKLDPAVNEPPAISDGGQGPVSLLGAPIPTGKTPAPPHKSI